MRTFRIIIRAWMVTLVTITAMSVITANAEEGKVATDNEEELAKKLANPIASLISVPLQYNYDEYGGLNDKASVSRLNVQPVVPISLTDQWNVITRTIVPFIAKHNFPLDAMNESGLGDIVASQFFSPKMPTAGGWIWGVGPVELLPSATDEMLGGKKWGLGPTGVALKQVGPWTVGMLANHIWSVAGDDERADINATFLQPFVAYITKTKTTLSLQTESTYDWENETWSVPVIGQVSQMFKIGPQILQFGVGVKYYAKSPDSGPAGWGFRAQLTFLFPN